MNGIWLQLFILVAVVGFQNVFGEDDSEKRKEVVDTAFISLPINSKFWNPQLDDKNNMELIGIEYLDDGNKTAIPEKKLPLAAILRSDERNWTSYFFPKPKKSDRFFVWGLLNLMKPSALAPGSSELNLRTKSKNIKDTN